MYELHQFAILVLFSLCCWILFSHNRQNDRQSQDFKHKICFNSVAKTIRKEEKEVALTAMDSIGWWPWLTCAIIFMWLEVFHGLCPCVTLLLTWSNFSKLSKHLSLFNITTESTFRDFANPTLETYIVSNIAHWYWETEFLSLA